MKYSSVFLQTKEKWFVIHDAFIKKWKIIVFSLLVKMIVQSTTTAIIYSRNNCELQMLNGCYNCTNEDFKWSIKQVFAVNSKWWFVSILT